MKPRRALTVATVLTGVAIGAAIFDAPHLALAAATIAAAGAFSVLRHLINLEDRL